MKNQIGCGYCHIEKQCKKRDGKTNFAKLGCEEFKHWEDGILKKSKQIYRTRY